MSNQEPQQANDLLILGAALAPEHGILEIIAALYYLPAHYKVVLPAGLPEDKAFQDEVRELVRAYDLQERVHFGDGGSENPELPWPQAAISLPEAMATASDSSPEALASAVLAAARKRPRTRRLI